MCSCSKLDGEKIRQDVKPWRSKWQLLKALELRKERVAIYQSQQTNPTAGSSERGHHEQKVQQA
jgi:hypothetical protein